MMETRQLKYNEMPEGMEGFFLVRLDSEGQIILEQYEYHKNRGWDSKIIHEFHLWTTYDKEKVLKEAEAWISTGIPLYIEEDTFFEEIT